MRKLSGLRRYLGTNAALRYLKDYHCSRIDLDGSWAAALHTLWFNHGEEDEVMEHARFMDKCGPDLIRYRWRAQ